ncbi:helicase-related protein [Paenibacillus sp. SYP-B4298]|uniref:helicase-related protein n=1 Tax=Paenibacillus sp. SYP-B4298 TaxID=2996034 RepID=UPI0022DD15D2|nr:helicase-related protein [Paenibacillus sp. SYP-B4298]
MKAVLYAAELDGGCWVAGCGIDMNVVALYTLDLDFRHGVAEQEQQEAGRRGRMPVLASCQQLLILDEEQPLGLVLEAAYSWNEQQGRRRSSAAQACRALEQLLVAIRQQHQQMGKRAERGDARSLARLADAARHEGGGLKVGEAGASWRLLRAAAGEGAERGQRRAQGHAWAAAAAAAAQALQGRALLHREAHALLAAVAAPPAGASWDALLQLAALQGRLRLASAVAAAIARRRRGALARALPQARSQLRCRRCGSRGARMRRTPCAACGRMCAYCEACLGMGRARECELLVLGSEAPGHEPAATAPAHAGSGAAPQAVSQRQLAARLRHWGLSPAQLAAAGEALRFIEAQPQERLRQGGALRAWLRRLGGGREEMGNAPREFLLWAVTGAGKTEMVFPLIESVVQRGGRVLLATPRRDVVLELDPRIRKAFPTCSVVTLYGGSGQRWEHGNITLSTTHQLFRFEEAFDLVIIDELDAFPYHNDPQLYYAARKAGRTGGCRILLSATPPEELQRAVRRGRLPHARVPVRYHRHPLPVPVLLRCPATAELLQKQRLPVRLLHALRGSIARGAQLFVFVAQIKHVEPLCQVLAAHEPQLRIAGTSSVDPQRTDKVQAFRRTDIRLLVTTTILERGVTVPRSDVFILDAGAGLFDAASLVQMAGRAGRSGDDPFGRVYLCSPDVTHSQAQAVRQIRTMNRIARRRGYLLPDTGGRKHESN